MSFYADLHIHSKHSRATSRDCDLEHLVAWAKRKGLTVIGTGDFTHPVWWDEIREKLVPAEPGLYRLRPEIEREVDAQLPAALAARTVRFLLEVEISTIYKKGEKTRKVHHLIYAAEMETAGRFRDALDRIGNIKSDGRPILGLDSRHLLEITLESGPDAYLIPAHIWTPWFAAMGSKSGFDSIDDCYGDLAEHIFAVETGLSSDPPMNWRLSQLDRFTLVSNSDAHSPPMLGREASVFDCDLDYFAMRRALETRDGWGGTIEFFPEEGKYHLDGHRACGVRLEPEETREHGGRCPSCGKPVTVGVLSRVEELADRPADARREQADPFHSIVPLPEIISELHGVGPKSKRVRRTVDALVAKLGSELDILETIPLEDVERHAEPLLAEGIRRIRSHEVRAEGGYDGEFGTIKLFQPEEIDRQMGLFAGLGPIAKAKPKRKKKTAVEAPAPAPAKEIVAPSGELDPDQEAAASQQSGALLILAGPGSGKTRTLTHRIARLARAGEDGFLALTFTRRAAEEMRERLEALLESSENKPRELLATTFHALSLRILREQHARIGLDRAFRVADRASCLDLAVGVYGWTKAEAARRLDALSDLRRQGDSSPDLAAWRDELRDRDLVDLDDLIAATADLLDEHDDLREQYRARWKHLSIDEYQDIDAVQYRLVRLLAPDASAGGSLCAIGDPDQSIYRFRGADVGFFLRFREDEPEARRFELTRNYRSASTIVNAALQAVAPTTLAPDRRMIAASPNAPHPIGLHTAASEAAEAEAVVHTIESLIGGTSHFSHNSGRVDSTDHELPELAFNDFAVLYRAKSQSAALAEALDRSGIPFQIRSHERLSQNDEARLLLHEMETQQIRTEDLGKLLENAQKRVAATDADAGALQRAVDMLKPLAQRHGDDLRALTSEFFLGAEVDTWDPRAERVSLLTLHASKGLEFPVVFLVGCEDGLLPLRSGDDIDVAEERRLFFVGMTRARQRLYLSWSKKRFWRGERREVERSPFLSSIEEKLLRRSWTLPRAKPREPKIEQLTLLDL